MDDQPGDFPVRDSNIVVLTEEIETLKERLYCRGNRRLRSLNRARRRQRRKPGPQDAKGGGPGRDSTAAGDEGMLRAVPPAVSESEATGRMVAHWLSELDRAGVESAVIQCEAPTTRDFIHRFLAQGRGRLQAFTSLDPLQTWSTDDLRKDVCRGFSGLNLLPGLQHFHLYDERAYGLYETCEHLRVPIMVHFGLTDSPFADLRYANPLDLQPVARDFPDLPFIVASLGSGFLRELLMVMEACPNVYADTSGFHLWLRFQPDRLDLAQVLRMFLDTAGAERLIFGSGSGTDAGPYRMELLELQRDILADLLPESSLAAVLGRTIERLLSAVDRRSAARRPKGRFRLSFTGGR